MTYTAPTVRDLDVGVGTDHQVLQGQLAAIATELGTMTSATTKAAIQYADLTASMVSSTSLAANGVDLAPAADATFYCVFVAPQAMTIRSMQTYLTEIYVKKTVDAKIELVTNADVPVTLVTYTLPEAGRAAKTLVATNPVVAALAAGDAINLKITATGNDTGSGHAKVYLKYSID
jgi:hypothetical protein